MLYHGFDGQYAFWKNYHGKANCQEAPSGSPLSLAGDAPCLEASCPEALYRILEEYLYLNYQLFTFFLDSIRECFNLINSTVS